MHSLKIALLLLLTLVIMRVASYALKWLLSKLPRISKPCAAISANLLCFLGFVALLYIDLERDEPVDAKAILFGALVFACYATFDIYRARVKSTSRPEPL